MNNHALECIRKAGAVAGEALEMAENLIDEGVRYIDIALEVEEFIKKKGARPAFPVNISVNEIAAHFTPAPNDGARFKRGDLVKIDVGAHVEGFIGDTAATVEVGTRNYEELIRAAEEALRIAIDVVNDGVSASVIGGTIERTIKDAGFKPVVNLTGHSMTQYNLHAGLSIPNIDDGITAKVCNDMVVSIEPFATNGAGEVRSGKLGNIYRISVEKPIKDVKAKEFFDELKKRFKTLPFCDRWCQDISKEASVLIKYLYRHGLISGYPVLVEVDGGVVSQAEHTVFIHNSKKEITTLRKP